MNLADPTREPSENKPAASASPPRTDVKAVAPSPLRQRLPQPGFVFALALTTVPHIVQFAVVILLSAVALLFLLATARLHEARAFFEGFGLILLPVGTFATLLVAVAVSWLFFGRTTSRKIAWRRVSVGQLLCVLALTVPLAVLASEVTNCAGALLLPLEPDWLRQFRESSGEMFQQFAVQPVWLVFLGACLLPGLGEEIYCRGLLSHGLVARYGVVGGTLLASGLFGVMHIEPVHAIGAFTLGIGLQFVFLTTRSLIAPIVLHTLNNSVALLSLRFAETYPIPGLTPLPDGGAVHTPITVLVTAVLAAAALMAIMFQNRTRWRLPDGTDWSPGYVTAEMPDASLQAAAVRAPIQPLFALAAIIALGLLAAAIVAAHLSVAVAAVP